MGGGNRPPSETFDNTEVAPAWAKALRGAAETEISSEKIIISAQAARDARELEAVADRIGQIGMRNDTEEMACREASVLCSAALAETDQQHRGNL